MYARYFKRLMDATGALILLLFFSWLLLLIIIVYGVQWQWPVIYVQERIGRNESVFRLYKFRTLKTGGGTPEERRFAWGNFLRRTSLDELPQLINVLKGEMSLIGPRPLPVEYLDLFSTDQRRRHQVRPGITGLAQVNGRNAIDWDTKFSYDLEYVNNITLRRDMNIVFKTIRLILSFGKDLSLSEKKFTGRS